MAIKKDQGTTQNSAPEMDAGKQTHAGAATQATGRARGYADLNTKFRRPLSRHTAGEAVNRYAEAMRETLRAQLGDSEDAGNLKILVLDGASQMLPMSSVLVLMKGSNGQTEELAVYTLMIEGSISGNLANRTVNINGRSIEIATVPGDVFDDIYWSRIQQFVTGTIGKDVPVHDAGCYVVPKELAADDEARVSNVLFNAATALFAELDKQLGGMEERFSVGMINKSLALSARLDYATQNDEDAGGLPIRSDINITLQGAVSDGNQSQYEQALNLTKIDGFVDLVYDANASQPQQNFGPWGQQQPTGPMRQYIPRMVLTDIDSELDAVTMELQLLGLSTATMMSQNHAWAGVFLPNYSLKEGHDMRDIGAIGWEVNLTGDPQAAPQAVDTKAEEFSRDNLYQLLSATVDDSLLYSMDVEETGALNWIHGAFLASANGNVGATNMILEAANNLTNGEFAKLWDVNAPIAIDEVNRIHLGYYVDEHGQRRDIRELDYLAMLNLLGGKDMKTVVTYADTFDRKEIPLEVRMEDRARILKATLGDSVEIKGYARRITFNPSFIEALSAACHKAGLMVRPTNVTTEFGSLGVRGNADAHNYAVRGMQGSMWQSASPKWNVHGANSFNNPGGRWGR